MVAVASPGKHETSHAAAVRGNERPLVGNCFPLETRVMETAALSTNRLVRFLFFISSRWHRDFWETSEHFTLMTRRSLDLKRSDIIPYIIHQIQLSLILQLKVQFAQ